MVHLFESSHTERGSGLPSVGSHRPKSKVLEPSLDTSQEGLQQETVRESTVENPTQELQCAIQTSYVSA